MHVAACCQVGCRRLPPLHCRAPHDQRHHSSAMMSSVMSTCAASGGRQASVPPRTTCRRGGRPGAALLLRRRDRRGCRCWGGTMLLPPSEGAHHASIGDVHVPFVSPLDDFQHAVAQADAVDDIQHLFLGGLWRGWGAACSQPISWDPVAGGPRSRRRKSARCAPSTCLRPP